MNKAKVKRNILLSLGLIMLAVGIFTNGHEDVFRKAIMICFECIGIG